MSIGNLVNQHDPDSNVEDDDDCPHLPVDDQQALQQLGASMDSAEMKDAGAVSLTFLHDYNMPDRYLTMHDAQEQIPEKTAAVLEPAQDGLSRISGDANDAAEAPIV
ncbi:hypothetical protein RI367_008803 [Sorochytrium milnesiophthora]